ncbi:MAG: NAD(P)/FAD-dependent oxidoreductase [Pseudomonadota bacterium]
MTADVIIIGAGAAGMMCAIEAARRGRRVLLLDHSARLAEKIRISGGGRCNFTNVDTRPENFLSDNPHFCRSALARYTPQHFVELLQQHNIGYHEKKAGQLFCDDKSEAIIAMLKKECDAAGVQWMMPCSIHAVDYGSEFIVATSRGEIRAAALVVATGGLSIPKIGATPFGYHIAQQFGIAIVKPRPGLVPLTFHPDSWARYSELAGISVDALVGYGGQSFRENLLFTHRGLSGPAILQISSYWEPGRPLHINLLPQHDILELFEQQRGSRVLLDNFLAQYWPRRFAEVWCAQLAANKPLNQYTAQEFAQLAAGVHDWQITPSGTAGYAKAEVTCGGVDTRALSSRTMQANTVPGLYFIGEVVDVTGQLGGYNFQWAWASGHAAGQHC